VFYAYNPVRDAVMIIGGDTTGDDPFYERNVKRAEDLWTHDEGRAGFPWGPRAWAEV
jgi:hypothetical protein